MPSGSKVKIQGYEHYALDELLKKYNEEQIVIERKNVPRILYELNGKEHYYFPDIYIPHENKIIEVKSKWTFEHKKEITNAKEIYCKKAGYKFELWIFSKDGIRI
jgi:hypothetical protein